MDLFHTITNFLTREKEAVTTSIDDALPRADQIKDFPVTPAPKDVIREYKKTGVLKLKPGVYDFNFQSFCLHAGKYGPYKGEGYLIARLEGPGSDTVRHILKNSVSRSDIPQQDVQTLVWAVLSNESYDLFSPNVMRAADALFEKDDISFLAKRFLAEIPAPVKDFIMGEVEKRLPPELLAIRDRVNELKSKLRDAATTYAELEKIAVNFGKPPVPENMLNVPEGTWSRIADNCFIRIFPEGYSRTRMQVYVSDARGLNGGPGADTNVLPSTDGGSGGGGATGGGSSDGGASDGGASFSPSDLSGVPANTNMQRLGFGGLLDGGPDSGNPDGGETGDGGPDGGEPDGGAGDGGADAGPQPETLTDAQATARLNGNGHIRVNDANRTSLEGVRTATIDGVIAFQEASGVDIVITGGTEDGHAAGAHSHENGYKLDFRNSDDVTNYIENNFQQTGTRANGDVIYSDGNGNQYCHETHGGVNPHWDVTYQ